MFLCRSCGRSAWQGGSKKKRKRDADGDEEASSADEGSDSDAAVGELLSRNVN